jgi:hypothetical protein
MKSPKKRGGTSAFPSEEEEPGLGTQTSLAEKLLLKVTNYDTVESERASQEERGRSSPSPEDQNAAKIKTALQVCLR